MNDKYKELIEIFDKNCNSTVVGTESTLHQLSPYIGKIKSSIADFLIKNFTKKEQIILDPFCGAGTIPLEAWINGRNVIASDLNRYAFVLTSAKLNPPVSISKCLKTIKSISCEVKKLKKNIDLRKVPKWVRSFFHNETLREIIVWVKILNERKEWFILSCLMGILHHQRPGFLSFPSSHTVPYLRVKNFPKAKYPELYKYREVEERLVKKVMRAYKRIPKLDDTLMRKCYASNATELSVSEIDAIITSPPYMRKLDYARDNRLRLFFLGVEDYKAIDKLISPKENNFIELFLNCLTNWKKCLKKNGYCIFFLGDNYSKNFKMHLPEIIEHLAINVIGGYKLCFKHSSIIPDRRRVRKYKGNTQEIILVFQKF
jgi:DNA modification methylase